jgi:hypothetical protein
MDSVAPAKESLGERAIGELREFAVIAAYLYICFTALAYLKAAILQAEGIVFAPFAFAAVKALLCAKFMSLGHAVRLGERFKKRALIWPTLHRTIIYAVLIFVLSAIEEVIVGVLHHRSVTDSLAGLGGGTMPQLIATCIVMLLILIPFFAFRSLSDVIGERVLLRLFFEPRRKVDHG